MESEGQLKGCEPNIQKRAFLQVTITVQSPGPASRGSMANVIILLTGTFPKTSPSMATFDTSTNIPVPFSTLMLKGLPVNIVNIMN